MGFIETLKARILILDGAMGTRLRELGYDGPLQDLANLHAPDLVRQTHREYREAGADILETNTFSANSFRLRAAGSEADAREINLVGVRLAREAANGAFVFGAIGPCGKPLMPLGTIESASAYNAFVAQAEALVEGRVDGFILETFADLDELEVAISAVRSVSSLPIIASKNFIEDGETLAEGFPLRAARRMAEAGADVVGANCVVGPQRMHDIIRWMAEAGDVPISAMPTPGMPMLMKKELTYDTTPEYFGAAAAKLIDAGANIVGGCCGTTPAHIAQLALSIKDRAPRVRALARTAEAAARKPLEVCEPSELSKKVGKKFIVTVELDLPRGLDTSKVLTGAASLKEKGVDTIDISDGARARLRMTPLAICNIIQREVRIETMMHVACRDRNLLALQADLLAAHALGLRNVLAITGDPANIGDFPSATSVFDIDAVGLVRVLSRFNEGVDMAGNSVSKKCAFTIAVAFNPVARDIQAELTRLCRKADAGAHIIYTQPLFEKQHAEFACEQAMKLDLPIFIGVLPLRSQRHAEFMHNEVPGIEIPDWLRKQMANAGDDAVETGISVAQELGKNLPTMAQGIYLMPPFGNHQVAERVIEALSI
ncbi:MAG: bifunctional homocysteine S-methyltransferase/methylenetetrahydrofolate reductase [Fimbriimonadales bacterium]